MYQNYLLSRVHETWVKGVVIVERFMTMTISGHRVGRVAVTVFLGPSGIQRKSKSESRYTKILKEL